MDGDSIEGVSGLFGLIEMVDKFNKVLGWVL